MVACTGHPADRWRQAMTAAASETQPSNRPSAGSSARRLSAHVICRNELILGVPMSSRKGKRPRQPGLKRYQNQHWTSRRQAISCPPPPRRVHARILA